MYLAGENYCAWTLNLKRVWCRRVGARYDGMRAAESMISRRRRTYKPLSLPYLHCPPPPHLMYPTLMAGNVPCLVYAAQGSPGQSPLLRIRASAELISLGDIRLVAEVNGIGPMGSAGNLSIVPYERLL